MADELDVLGIIGERLESAGIPFMLTGSFALGYYGKPRMTRENRWNWQAFRRGSQAART